MKMLYLLLDGITVFFPLILSFDKKVAFYKTWRYLLYGFVLVGLPFVLWDILFTANGVWGFNADYLTGIKVGNLPLEEVLFFIVVPFSCTFILACVKVYFPKLHLTGFNRVFYAMLCIYALIVLIYGKGGMYSTSSALLALLSVPVLTKIKVDLRFLPLAFLIALVPFFLVNGVLTGSGLEAPIVWYNENEISGFRFFTIPIEDVVYGWVLLAANATAYQYFLERGQKRKPIRAIRKKRP